MKSIEIGRRSLFGVVSLFLIAACGGGGGGGGDVGKPPSSPSPPPPAGFSIDTTNAPEVVNQLGTIVNGLFEFGISIAENSRTFINRGTSHAIQCRNANGEVRFLLRDVDGDGRLSAGDEATITFDGCEVRRSASRLTGSLEVQLLELHTESAIRLTARVSTVGPLLDVSLGGSELSGTVEVFVYLTDTTEILEIRTPPGTEIRYDYEIPARLVDTVDTISGLTASREARVGADGQRRFSMAWDLALDSTALPGALACRTTASLKGPFGDDPDSGTFVCQAGDDSQLRVAPDPSNSAVIVLDVDENGDGTFANVTFPPSGASDWQAAGFLFCFSRPVGGSEGVTVGPVQIPKVATARYDGDVSAAAYDESSNRLYVGTGDQLVVLDAGSFDQLESMILPYQPQTIDVSDDGSTVWIGYVGQPVLQSVSIPDMLLGPQISLASPPPAVDPGPVEVTSLAVAPGSTDRVVANTTSRGLVAIESGVALETSLTASPVVAPHFLDEQTLVMGLMASPHFDDLSVVRFDPARGLSVVKTLPDYLDRESKQLANDGRLVYSGTGRIFEVASGTIKGRIPRGYDLETNVIAFNADKTEMYTFYSNTVSVYTPDPLRLRATYRTDRVQYDVSRGFFESDQYLFLADSTGITRVARADLSDNFPSTLCDLFDLSGLAVPGFLLRLRCDVTDAVYDASRDTLLVATSGNGGQQAGRILFVDPQSGNIQDSLNLGALPGEIRLSRDRLTLYVAMAESTEIAVVDLAARSLRTLVNFGFREDESGTPIGPYIVSRSAVSPANSADIVAAATNNDLAVFVDRSRAAQIASADSAVGSISLSADGGTALVLSRTESALFNVSAAGVVKSSVLDALLPENHPAQQDDEVFAVDGRIFSFADQSVSMPCSPTSGGGFGNAVGPSRDGNRIYYVGRSFSGYEVDVCDRATGNLTPQAPIGIDGENGPSLIAALPMNNGLLAIVHTEGVLISEQP